MILINYLIYDINKKKFIFTKLISSWLKLKEIIRNEFRSSPSIKQIR